MNERWAPVVGYEGLYEVSDHGRMRSIGRIVMRRARPMKVPARDMKIRNSPPAFYSMVTLSKNGKQTMAYVHRLVLEAFVGPCPPDMETLHNNGVRADCRLENLHWGTHAENIRDVVRHGNAHGGKPKEHCPQGHSYNDRDVNKAGHHFCRVCLRAGAVVRNVRVSDNDGRCRSRYLAPHRAKHIRCVEPLGHLGDHQAPYYNETWPVDSAYILTEEALPQKAIDALAAARR